MSAEGKGSVKEDTIIIIIFYLSQRMDRAKEFISAQGESYEIFCCFSVLFVCFKFVSHLV